VCHARIAKQGGHVILAARACSFSGIPTSKELRFPRRLCATGSASAFCDTDYVHPSPLTLNCAERNGFGFEGKANETLLTETGFKNTGKASGTHFTDSGTRRELLDYSLVNSTSSALTISFLWIFAILKGNFSSWWLS
jgi:hypothetical protein